MLLVGKLDSVGLNWVNCPICPKLIGENLAIRLRDAQVVWQQTSRFPLIARYVATALLIASPGFVFSAKAVSVHLYRQSRLEIGIGIFDVPGIPGMPINTYIRWMLVFSTPFFVFAAFVLYRLIIRLTYGPSRDSISG